MYLRAPPDPSPFYSTHIHPLGFLEFKVTHLSGLPSLLWHTQPLVLQTNANELVSALHSFKITGHRLLQESTLTDVETRYVYIERNAFPCALGLRSFIQMYTANTTVQNDHKPLEMIQRKPYMQHHQDYKYMLLRLQKYDSLFCISQIRTWSCRHASWVSIMQK